MKREKKVVIKKQAYLCFDGPFIGSTLYLATPFTPVFTIGGRTGRYRISYNPTLLVWEDLNEINARVK